MQSVFVLGFVLFVGVLAAPISLDGPREYATQCLAENGYDIDTEEGINDVLGSIFNDDDKLYCVTICVMKKRNILTPEGNLNPEMTHVSEKNLVTVKNKTDNLIDKCGPFGDVKTCADAKKWIKCIGD